jgi:hypothetical protein
MTQLSVILNSMHQSVNESIIDDLVDLGFDHTEAVKMVVQYDDFDLFVDSLENPADQF